MFVAALDKLHSILKVFRHGPSLRKPVRSISMREEISSLKPCRENFGDDLHGTILKADYWSKGARGSGVTFFGQQHHVRPVEVFQVRHFSIKPSKQRHHPLSDHVPGCLKETWTKSVRAGCTIAEFMDLSTWRTSSAAKGAMSKSVRRGVGSG
jgi:hypothetical protein